MPTIKDIAKAASCSLSTVSKAINGRSDISEATRERILKIAEELNFSPNNYKRGVIKQNTENIGVIFCRESQPLSINPFYSRILEGIEAECAINNHNLILHLLPQVYRGEFPKMLKERTVDGVILVGVFQDEFIKQLDAASIPVILVNPNINFQQYSEVMIDNEHGAFLAIQYLIDRGHEKIAFVSDDLAHLSLKQRLTGFRKAMAHRGIPVHEDYIETVGREQGYANVSAIINRVKEPPTAIFVANDINAIYGYKAIKDAGLRIPHDISVMGFDDIALAKIASPQLTTIRVYKEEMGSIAVRKLLGRINNREEVSTTIVPVKVVERESVKTINPN